MAWLAIGLFSAVLFSFVNIIDKIFLVHFVRNERQAAVVVGLFSQVCFLFLYGFFTVPAPSYLWVPSFLSGVFEILYIYFYLRAIKQDEVGYLVPFFGLSSIIAYLASVTIFGDKLSFFPVLGVLVVCASVFLLQYAKYGVLNFKPNSALLFMIGAVTLYACQGLFLHYDGSGFTTFQQFTVSRLGVFAGAILLVLQKPKDIIGVLVPKNYIFLFSEALYLVATYLFIVALSLGNAAYVLSVLNIQPLFVLAGSYFLKKLWPHLMEESFGWRIKWLAPVSLCLIGAGIVFLEM